MTQWIIPILTFVSVCTIGGALILARAARRHHMRARLEAFGDTGVNAGQLVRSEPNPLARWLEKIGKAVTPKAGAQALQRRLVYAGFFSSSAPMIYTGVKTLMTIIGVLVAAAFVLQATWIMPVKIMVVLGVGFGFSLIPSWYVDFRHRQRATEIQHAIPDAVDLLEICVSAGMGLDMAWNAVSDEIRRVSPILADEMALTNLEIHMGGDRAKALRNMADRTRSEELNALVGTLVQSERFGTTVADALKVFAESMREARHARAAEAAEKLGLKMLFPMIAFILPSILIVMGGGAVIKIMRMFEMM